MRKMALWGIWEGFKSLDVFQNVALALARRDAQSGAIDFGSQASVLRVELFVRYFGSFWQEDRTSRLSSAGNEARFPKPTWVKFGSI